MIISRDSWSSKLIGSVRRVHSNWNIGPYNLQQGPNARLYFVEPLQARLQAVAVIPLQQLIRQEKRRDQGHLGTAEEISATFAPLHKEIMVFGCSAVRQTVIDDLLYASCCYAVQTAEWIEARKAKKDMSALHLVLIGYPQNGCIVVTQEVAWNMALTLNEDELNEVVRGALRRDRLTSPEIFDRDNVVKVNFGQ